ncbi:hypothetical protein JCM19232_1109 [Vibrio ishigakensis]|uniref:Uncharacterized protein n=1 Tax=Vibrio ishigakensis TaxID=1481914 RepID=A0A0B8QPA9_9VIBR|nr:hypothetical protein [Vibrio ishigakensis]GAM58873.1 hypothetical protein JCM19231_38 [Vibrio ishigakensis]GAM64439.1 hypothetical protein JCM19232_1109 [Vibrio ishigakensis]GAM76239.1 hypothetical protein JCM19241_537 [Vibrio ishigakensis]
MTTIRDRIEDLEQQIYIACSEGNFETMNNLEQQLEMLRGKASHVFEDDPYAIEGRFQDDETY